MRRILSILFFLGVIVWGLFVYSRRDKQASKSSAVTETSREQATVTHTAVPIPGPRLARKRSFPNGAAAALPKAKEEASVMQRIRANVKTNPRLAESLARQDRARFPNSPHADERDALLVDALINQQRIGAARSETYYYLDHHPHGRFAAHLFIMTGVHPMPHGPEH